MGETARAAMAAGGRVIGVIPSHLNTKERAYHEVELRVVETMHERKQTMADLADGFIALPGGLGTFDELFEILTWNQIGLHGKPVGLLNVAGYFDALLRRDRAGGAGRLRAADRAVENPGRAHPARPPRRDGRVRRGVGNRPLVPYAFGFIGGRARASIIEAKPHFACEPSQNGLFADWPQRHRPMASRPARSNDFPVSSTISKSPSTRMEPLFFTMILVAAMGFLALVDVREPAMISDLAR